ncbi:alpha-sarcoglycan isoform X2 [Leptidea sinapis]|uniref:alpha-sarcoglycan isoform X2 n=1 Tax=Leptidea sinapis TaxID=189913 RepID=UPI002131FFF8|nr:alpha-sarcoglycan isoform X2 [Leptidea sinapis]
MVLVWLLLVLQPALGLEYHAVETEMFAIPVSPNLFNWTYQEFDQQYRFHASLAGSPELTSWLRYLYSGRHHSGFIFGTPPRGTLSPITLEVIGLNRQDYETRRTILTLNILPKDSLARHEVELKIDNLNVEDLLDQHRMTKLKDILRTKLWLESNGDLYPTFLSSAIDLGARLPLKPSDGEGLVVRLGSSVPFSSELKRLREEVRPLSRLPSCPREFKRTTVERLFRDAGFTLDWCSFELYNTVYNERSTQRYEYLTEIPNTNRSNSKVLGSHEVWRAPSKHALPSRSYLQQLSVTIALPLLLMLLSVATLSAILCFQYAGVQKSGRMELCKYGTGNTDQTQLADNDSSKSLGASPNNSLVRPYSPKSSSNLAGSYHRPQPPPYSSATNSLHHRRSLNTDIHIASGSGHTPEHNRHLALEESLKLLNEANIASEFDNLLLKDPVLDLTDGCDDYVPIRPDTIDYVPLKPDHAGYVSMNPELDDIIVPELSKFGVPGVGI